MKTVAVIPARYQSSRFAGKPLADLCGRPMLWWVYRQVSRCSNIDAVYVATDHEAIRQVCEQYDIPCCMISPHHSTSTERLYEAAKSIPADIIVCVNGDEPLIEPSLVEKVIPASTEGFFAANLMTKIKNPVEAVDETNIKVVTSPQGDALFFSRSPIPHPKASVILIITSIWACWRIPWRRFGSLPKRPQALSNGWRTSTSFVLWSTEKSSP